MISGHPFLSLSPFVPHRCRICVSVWATYAGLGTSVSQDLASSFKTLSFCSTSIALMIRSSLVVPTVLVCHIIQSSLASTGICKDGSLDCHTRILQTGIVDSAYPLPLHKEKRSLHSSTATLNNISTDAKLLGALRVTMPNRRE